MAGVIQLSEALSLALHGMGLLAARGGRMNAHALAAVIGASEAHLAKVFQRLGKAGLVESVRGPGGGFVLAKDAAEIRLIDIYEAVEGRPSEGGCLLRCGTCPFGACLFGGLLERMTGEFVAYLRTKTLADLTKGARHE